MKYKSTILAFIIIISISIIGCDILIYSDITKKELPTISHLDRSMSSYSLDYSKNESDNDIKSFIIKNSKGEDVLINRAIKDSTTGQMIAHRELNGIVISAKSHTVSEREGIINLDFMISIPQSLIKSDCQTIFKPLLVRGKDTIRLRSIALSGQNFYKAQKRGYAKYEQYLNSIIPEHENEIENFTYINDLIIFLDRYLPQSKILEGKKDPELKNEYGLTEEEVINYYKKWWLIKRNRKKIEQIPQAYNKYIRTPYIKDLKLDSIVRKANGSILYHYTQQLNSSEKTGKIDLFLTGVLKNSRGLTRSIKCSDSLTYYVSSMINFIDTTPVYYKTIVPIKIDESYTSDISFAQNSAIIESSDKNNIEINNIQNKILAISQLEKYKIDSIIITANTSPEGSYKINKDLSQNRAYTVKTLIDSILSNKLKDRISNNITIRCHSKIGTQNDLISILENNVDRELLLYGEIDQKRLIQERYYPKMRSVKIDFNLSKIDNYADTIYSNQLDTIYIQAIDLLKKRDYNKALELLKDYRDLNCAIAYMSLARDHSALDILNSIKDTPTSLYLKAIIYARLNNEKLAVENFIIATDQNPSLFYRAILDPEISFIIQKYNIHPNE